MKRYLVGLMTDLGLKKLEFIWLRYLNTVSLYPMMSDTFIRCGDCHL